MRSSRLHNPTGSPVLPSSPRRHSVSYRRNRLRLIRIRRIGRTWVMRLTLLSGWAWVAAASLVGFEMFDIIFGAFILAPELLPLVIIALACIWFFRDRVQQLVIRARTRFRGARESRPFPTSKRRAR